MTDEDFRRWLASGGQRCVLIEIDSSPMLRFSDAGYTTAPSDAPPNTPFPAVIAGGVSLSEGMDSRLNVGTIQLHNENGALDYLFDEVIDGREIRIFYGDRRWPYSDFKLQVRGVVKSLEANRKNRIVIFLADKLAELEVPVTEETIGGTDINKDAHKPVVFGEIHNMTAVLEHSGLHRFRVGLGAIEDVIEARANGAPILITKNLASGTFTTDENPYGTITASVQGDKTGGVYRNTIGPLIQLLATSYGPFTSTDIDTANFSAFNSANTQPVGIALMDRTTVLRVCQQFADSVGATLTMSRLGKLRLQQIDFPVAGGIEIHPKDYEFGSLHPKEEMERIGAVKLGYCRNYTVQESLAERLPASSVANFQLEWLTVVAKASAVLATYPQLDSDPEMQETLLLLASHAQAEADRRLAIYSERRTVYQLKGLAQLIPIEPGDRVVLYGDRELSTGKPGIVINAKPDWSAGRNTLEVLT